MKKRFLETISGKIILIVVIYVLYWFIFYGSWFIMPERWFMEYDSSTYEIKNRIMLTLLLLIIPALSFLIPHYLLKKIKINKKFLYILHIILIILSIIIFFYIGLGIAIKNFSIG